MRIVTDFLFLDDVSEVKDSQELFNSSCGTLTIQVNGTGIFSFSVLGCTDLNKNNYETLSPINMTTYNNVSSITENGIYIVPVNGVSRIKCSISSIDGILNVFGKLGD